VSTLPPPPPKYRALADQNYAAALQLLNTVVPAQRTDPKRRDGDNADYHNTVTAMLMHWDEETGDNGTGILTMCAAALIELADAGWPDTEHARRGIIDPNPAPPRPPWWRRVNWRGVGVWVALAYGAGMSVYAAYIIDQVN
jgi:hypothetical protein